MSAATPDRAPWTALALALALALVCAAAALAWIVALNGYMAAFWDAGTLRYLC